MTRGRRAGFGVLLVLGLAGLEIGAQTPPPQGTPPPSPSPSPQRPQPPPFRAETNFVRVDVYPTHDGVPVQDLTAADFELFEDGAPQKVDSFEHVVVRPAGPQETRIDPSSPSVANQMAADAHRRVFVVYLDTETVSVEGSHTIAEPLIRLMTRILGPDDLVGIMTPEMTAQDITFGRKTEVIEEGLRKNWTWGRRFTIMPNAEEQKYEECYPPLNGERAPSALAKALILRRRERIVLDSLRDLIRHLGSIREGRTAVLTVTEGWLLYRPDETLTRLRQDPVTGRTEPVPGIPPIGVGPDGKLTMRDKRNPAGSDKYECDSQRMDLAMHDDEVYFRDLLGEANRANVSFYPIDPRGLPASDTPIGPDPPLTPVADRMTLTARLETMRTLAANTDGIPVMDSNDLDKGLRRLADDLTSYYLLGYYSTNTKLDGRFRSIKVRVTRPGVVVRARKGYQAPTLAEVSAARAAASAPVPDASRAVNAALGTLSSIVPDGRLRLRGVAASGAGGTTVWVEGEIPAPAHGELVTGAASVDIDVKTPGASSAAHLDLEPTQRAFLTSVRLTAEPGASIEVRARLRSGGAAAGSAEVLQIQAPSAGDIAEPLLFRRGPNTGNKLQPAADRRFSRTERLHLETATPADAPGWTGALLDRAGARLAVPVSVAERIDSATGQRWLVGDIILAPLGIGDYIVELTTGGPAQQQRTWVAFRIGQ